MFYVAGDLKGRVEWVLEAGTAATRHGFLPKVESQTQTALLGNSER